MTASGSPAAEDIRLRGTVMTIVAAFGLAALAMLVDGGWAVDFAAVRESVPTDMTNSAGALWSCGFGLAAIPMGCHRPSRIPKTLRTYGVALIIALILCCRRSPLSLHPTVLDHINWPNMLCFLIPPAGAFVAGALIRYGLWLIHSSRS